MGIGSPVDGRQIRGQYQRRRDGRHSFATTGEAEAVRGGRRDGHGRIAGMAERGLGLVPPRSEPGPVADHLHGNVPDLEAGGAHSTGDLREQCHPRGARPPGVGRAELCPEVCQSGGGEQRVTAGVRDDVRIGVAVEATLPRPVEAAEPQVPPGVRRGVRVDIGADTDARQE